jgi:hypothetical protein
MIRISKSLDYQVHPDLTPIRQQPWAPAQLLDPSPEDRAILLPPGEHDVRWNLTVRCTNRI